MALHRYFIIAALLIAAPAPAMHGGRTHTDAPASSLYQSAFHGYQPFEDKPVASWRVVNETIAGSANAHAGHRMDSVKKPPAPVANDPHAGHDMKEMDHAP